MFALYSKAKGEKYNIVNSEFTQKVHTHVQYDEHSAHLRSILNYFSNILTIIQL